MVLPSHLARFLSIAQLLVAITATGVIASAADRRSGPIIRWDLTSPPLSRHARDLPNELTPSPLHGPQFGNTPPHALIFTSNQQQVATRLTNEQSASLPKTALSLEVWVRPEENKKRFGLIACKGKKQIGWILGGNADHFFFTLASEKKERSTQLTARPFYQTGQWYLVTATYDGQRQKLYVDGHLAGEAFEQRENILPLSSPEIFLGVLPPQNDGKTAPTFFAGQLGSVRLWDRALTATEIKSRFGAEQVNFPGALAVYDSTHDWPTFGHDNHRSGRAGAEPRLPLHLAWHRQILPAPEPAWPPPAKQDFWNNKINLRPRVTFDRCFEPVVSQGRIYLGSSSNDQLYCLDLETGKTLWRFFAEGPIRLAPTVADGRVLFGSDDGGVYCLDAQTGSEMWRYKPEGEYFPGNGRLVHPGLVRSGIFVEKDRVFFTAGLFPRQGVQLVSLDLHDGKRIGQKRLSNSPQGYLGRRGGRLFATTGRNLRGAVLESLDPAKKDPFIERPILLPPFDQTVILAGNVIFGGGAGGVVAFSREGGKPLWEASIEGTCTSLLLANEHLLASTQEGDLYCFTPKAQETPIDPPAPASRRGGLSTKNRAGRQAANILDASGLQKGYCLLLGEDLGDLAEALAHQSQMQIVVGVPHAQKAAALREKLHQRQLYGQIVVHDLANAKRLPYGDWIFNVVVANRKAGSEALPPEEEVWRVVRPEGGCLWNGADRTPTFRKPLDGTGEWTHLYGNAANTACSGDSHVRGPLALQWFGLPGPQSMVDRHHRGAAPLYKSGVLYVPGNEKIYGVDAYNGTVRWEVDVPGSRRIGVLRDCGTMCAAQKGIFVAAGKTCTLLSATDGQPLWQFEVPSSETPSSLEWGLVACDDGLLFGSGVPAGGIRRGHSRNSIIEGVYWDFRPIVISDSLFAFDQNTRKREWLYAPADRVILNPTITLGGEQIYFVEVAKPVDSKTTGRVEIDKALNRDVKLVALSAKTGNIAWEQAVDYAAIEHHLYALYGQNILVTVGSRNQPRGKKGPSQVWYDLHAYDAKTGKLLWKKSQNNQTASGGDHGEQDHHPVLVGNRLFVEPFAYNLQTGEPVSDWQWHRGHRGGCGTVSASGGAFFFRDSNAAMFDLTDQKHFKITQVSRPGCWINMIPAGSLLLIPEASSGCSCHFPVQASMAFRPASKDEEPANRESSPDNKPKQ